MTSKPHCDAASTIPGDDPPSIADVFGPKPGDTSWTKMLGLNTVGSTSILAGISRNALGLDTARPGMTALANAFGPKPGDTSWTKMLGLNTVGSTSILAGITGNALGPDIFGPTMTALLDAVGLEGLGETDSGELTGDIVEWLGRGEDYVAVVMVMAVVAVSVFLHEQGLDWAVAIVGAISTLLISRCDAH